MQMCQQRETLLGCASWVAVLAACLLRLVSADNSVHEAALAVRRRRERAEHEEGQRVVEALARPAQRLRPVEACRARSTLLQSQQSATHFVKGYCLSIRLKCWVIEATQRTKNSLMPPK